MAPSMARLGMILSILSSLFLLSLARHSIDLETKPETQIEVATKPETQIETLLPEESSTTVLTLDPNESTELEILDPTKKKVEEEKDTRVSNLALPDESAEREVVVDSDPGIVITEVIGWHPREDEEKKEEKVVRKKKGKKGDESDSDSDSDDEKEEEEEEEEERKKKKKKGKKGKKLGFWGRLLKLISPFE